MRRVLLIAAAAAAFAGCVSVEGMPDPHGALKPKQRLVVAVYPSPGPWIVATSDSKAESAAKISPLGFLVQSVDDNRTLAVSQNLQQYLPRPRLGLAVQESLLKALRTARSTDTVQTAAEAGIASAQLAEWNKSKDQLDWRMRYYAPDPEQSAPRDYARVLTLDDAVILDVNVSFGTDAPEAGGVIPQMSAASRAYRGDTSHLLWQHEDVVTDATFSSSSTLSDFQLAPWTLTDSLQKLAPTLGANAAASFLKAFAVLPSTAGVRVSTPSVMGGGLVPMSFFQNIKLSTSPSSGPAPAVSTSAVAATGVEASTAPAAVPVSSSTALAPAAATIAVSTAPAQISAPAPVSVSTEAAPAAAPAASSAPAASPAEAPPKQ